MNLKSFLPHRHEIRNKPPLPPLSHKAQRYYCRGRDLIELIASYSHRLLMPMLLPSECQEKQRRIFFSFSSLRLDAQTTFYLISVELEDLNAATSSSLHFHRSDSLWKWQYQIKSGLSFISIFTFPLCNDEECKSRKPRQFNALSLLTSLIILSSPSMEFDVSGDCKRLIIKEFEVIAKSFSSSWHFTYDRKQWVSRVTWRWILLA